MTIAPGAQRGGRPIRPYAITGGRTGAESEIALEALVTPTALGSGISDQFRWEAAEILRIADGTAVVELAALLDIPIGVVRVLVGDLTDMGVVEITNPPAEMEGIEGYTELLQKVLDGIRSL